MTNYNERLSEILEDFYDGDIRQSDMGKAKQAITSLIKELVADAKPDTSGFSDEYWRVNGSKVILMFEANLLKALEKL